MLRCIIIDDERHARESLSRLLAKPGNEIEIVAQCENIAEAEKAVIKYKPDLIFLDVEMPNGNGFDFLTRLKEVNFEIIFVTAFSQYAIQAIRFSALDFLLKPVVAEDISEALKRASNRMAQHQRQLQIEALLHNMNYLNADKKIALPTMAGLEFVTLGNIIRCESDNTYTVFHLVDKRKIIVSKSIGDYEEMLRDYHFLRVHQSHLINLRHVKNYQKGEGGLIVMDDNSAVDVSRRRKEQLISRLLDI